jgi:branched-chain amino acid transport system permease protein
VAPERPVAGGAATPARAVPRRRIVHAVLPLLVLALAAVLPWSTVDIPGIFDGPLNSPGTLQLLALCLVFGGLAAGYDLLFGRAGLLSFGHALYVAAGAYGVDILVTHAHWPLWTAVLAAALGGAALAALLGSVALRTTGIGFAMVTLAFAQVGSILVNRDPGGLTGGEEGLPMDGSRLPGALVGVTNTVNLYWLALAFLAVVSFVVHRIDRGPYGRVLAGLRDDERRVAVLGLSPYRFKLVTFTVSGCLAALGGVVYALVVGGASPQLTVSDLTLSLLVMTVLGGPGTRWGAVIGGIGYTYLDQRLTSLGGTSAVAHLPGVLRGPLSQPLFVLGAVFILAVYFAPGGLAGLGRRGAALGRALRRRGGTAGGGPGRGVGTG